MIDPGFYLDMSNDDYHASSAYSSSTLKGLLGKTMAHVEYQRDNPKKPSDSIMLGTITHSLVLEPNKFDKEYAVTPEGLTKPSDRILFAKKPSAESLKKIEEWNKWESESKGKTIISHEDYTTARAMADKVLDHPVIGCWFDQRLNGIAEASVFYNQMVGDKSYLCRVRPDWVIPGHPVLFDLKTTKDAGFSNFMRDCHKYMYHMSAAMYLEGCNHIPEARNMVGVDQFTDFVWIVVENEPPYEATYYEASKEDLKEGLRLYHYLMRRVELYESSEWKGYGDLEDNGTLSAKGRVSEIPKYSYNLA